MRNRLRHYFINLFVVVMVSFLAIVAPALGADTIKFALPGNSMGYLPLFVAVHRGFFKDEGLDIELPRLVPAMAQNALLAGEVQYHGLADSGRRIGRLGAIRHAMPRLRGLLWYDVREPNGDFRIGQTPAVTAAFSSYIAGACQR